MFEVGKGWLVELSCDEDEVGFVRVAKAAKATRIGSYPNSNPLHR